jgi:UDP-N-acetylmuramoyl-tripeptide--D-alanyl-D-alanine ligase
MAAASLPPNDVALSLADVARATGGELRGAADLVIRGVSTDSRADLQGKLFVALSGERFDGHDFVASARAQGAAAVLVERDVAAEIPAVKVPSTLAGLGALGALRRKSWGGKVVAVAGSAGKTTTRWALAALLDAAEPHGVRFSRGNFNNQVGVPLVLLSIEAHDRFAVVEIGTNQPGEVELLTRMVSPDVGILTLIGYEHTEGLGDLDGVEREEGALFAQLGGGIAIGNIDDERVARQLAAARGPRIGYGQSVGADYRFRILDVSERGTALEVTRRLGGQEKQTRFSVPSLGRPGAYAACAALAAVEALIGRGLEGALLDIAFRQTAGEAGRLNPIELTGGILLLDDTYNANPESVESSIETARQLADRRGVPLLLVLGEMRELGQLSAELHRKIGEAAAAQSPELLITVAGDARLIGESASARGTRSEFAVDSEAAAELLLERLLTPAVVLVKASRGVRAEKVVERVIAAKGRAA